ncbi:MAG: glutaminyl-peptide cyclotransferase, partial [Ferruginibacter sp.]
MKYLITISLVVLLAACNGDKAPDRDPDIVPIPSGIAAPKALSYTIISQFPHDTSSFTEGLEMYKGKLYESGGDYQSSRLQFG